MVDKRLYRGCTISVSGGKVHVKLLRFDVIDDVILEVGLVKFVLCLLRLLDPQGHV